MELPVNIPPRTKIPPENFGHLRYLILTVNCFLINIRVVESSGKFTMDCDSCVGCCAVRLFIVDLIDCPHIHSKYEKRIDEISD